MVIIYSKFITLDSQKRERIINAALKEFTQNGYEKASTNEIIKEAKISKGSLFNYFNSKKDLYLFLLKYVIEIVEKIYDKINYDETDLFNRLRDVGIIKLRIMKKFPQAFNFLKTVSNEDSKEVKTEILKISKNVKENGMERIFETIDLTKFRNDIDVQKTINIINWSMLSFAVQQTNQLNSYEDVDIQQLKEWDEYFDIMKRCFYK